MGKKRGKEARGKKFVNKYKEIQEKIKVQRSNQEYSREYEYEMVSTICESTIYISPLCLPANPPFIYPPYASRRPRCSFVPVSQSSFIVD